MGQYRLSSRNHEHRRRVCERRGNKRLLCSDLTQISWLDQAGRRRAEVAILENVSRTGLGLFCGVMVRQGAAIEVVTGDKRLQGTVSNCEFRENGYLVGVELDPESNCEVSPEHILDVSLLEFD